MTRQSTSAISADRKRALRLAAALIGVAVTLGACKTTGDAVVTTASFPDDYRLRHPIAIQEADRSIVVFVGRGRGGLSAAQRADVMYLGQTWMREGTGIISIDVPVNTPNARAAEDSLREIQATLAVATSSPVCLQAPSTTARPISAPARRRARLRSADVPDVLCGVIVPPQSVIKP